MKKSVLFLTLRVFSATGGIEKVCRVAGKALNEITESEDSDFHLFSMYDQSEEILGKYIPAKKFSGFANNKIKFTISSYLKGMGTDTVILSHINLLSIGFLIKLFSPKTRLILIAHGIEVWKPFSGIRKIMLSRCDLILPVSDFTKEKMKQLGGFAESKFIVHNNCLDPFLPEPSKHHKDVNLQKRYGFTNDHTILLTLTRISDKEQYKGYDHVLNSMKELLGIFPQLRYLIVGKYDAIEKKRMDRIIAELGIGEQVVFAGFIPDEALAAHFHLSDIYVMPSKKEGFGIVFIEAMHYGLPVIAGNKDGSVDALGKGSLGVLVNPDSQLEITDAIKKVMEEKMKYIPDHVLLMEKFSYAVYKSNLEKILNFK